MAICYKCGEAEAEIGLLCRECVQSTRQIKAELQTQAVSEAPARKGESFRLLSFENMLMAAFALVIVLFFARSFGAFGYGTLPALPSEGSDNASYDACSGKRRCMVVVLAPWCSACKASIPFVRAVGRYTESRHDLGLQILVGLDKRPSLLEMAGQVGSGAQLDPRGVIHKALGGGGVPSWGIIDQQRNILKRGSGLPGGLTESHPGFEAYLQSHFGFE